MYTETTVIDKPREIQSAAARAEFARRVEEWLPDPLDREPKTWDEDVSSPYGGNMTEQAYLEAREGVEL